MPIQSRYIAFKLSQFGNTKISINKQYQFEVVGDADKYKTHLHIIGDKGAYFVKVLKIDLPASVIEIVKS